MKNDEPKKITVELSTGKEVEFWIEGDTLVYYICDEMRDSDMYTDVEFQEFLSIVKSFSGSFHIQYSPSAEFRSFSQLTEYEQDVTLKFLSRVPVSPADFESLIS